MPIQHARLSLHRPAEGAIKQSQKIRSAFILLMYSTKCEPHKTMPIRHPPLSLVSTVPLNGGAPVETVEQAISFIDRNVPRELAALPRWTFAQALLVEARKTRNYETCGLPPAQSGIQQ